MKKLLFAILAVISFAASATTFEWRYSDVSPFNLNPPPATLVAHGFLTVEGDALVFEKITSFTGVVNGEPIIGLSPSPFSDANVFQNGTPFVTTRGIRFDVDGDIGHLKLNQIGFLNPIYYEFGDAGIPSGANVGNGIHVFLTVKELPATPIPEPSVIMMVLTSIGVLAFTRRRCA